MQAGEGGHKTQAQAVAGRSAASLQTIEPLQNALAFLSGNPRAAATVAAFRADGLFIGQSDAFFTTLNELAAKADMARREI